MIEAAIWLWLLLNPPAIHGKVLPLTWWWTIRAAGSVYRVDPHLAASVFRIESGWKAGPLGRKGTYLGPGGIHRGYLRKWPVDLEIVNLWIATRALQGQDLRRVLQRYNQDRGEKWERYYRAVVGLARQFRAGAVTSRKTTAKWKAGWRSWRAAN